MSAIGAKSSTTSHELTGRGTALARGASHRDRSRELLRAMLLDSACTQLLEQPWEALSMGDIARGAGVHRSSLYNEFGTRRNLIRALIAREADRLPAALSAPLLACSEAPAYALQQTFECFLDASCQNGLIAALLRRGETELRAIASTRRGATLERLSEAVKEAWPRLEREDCEQIVEWLFRFALSLARVPAGPSTAAHVGQLLGTYVQDRLPSPAGPVAPVQSASLPA